MTDFNFNIENADCELDDVEHLLTVFWEFFDQERPAGDPANIATALKFIQDCGIYGSLLDAAWDKIRAIHAEMVTAIKQHFHVDKPVED